MKMCLKAGFYDDFINGKNFRIIILAVLDRCCAALAAFGALILRFDISSIPEGYYMGATKELVIFCLPTIAVMAVFSCITGYGRMRL